MRRWEGVKMRRCKDEKIRYRPPLLEEPCAQTLSGKCGVIQKTLKNTTPQSSKFNTQPTPHSFIYLHATSHTPHSILYTSNSSFNTPHFFLLHTPYIPLDALYLFYTLSPHSTPYTLHSSLHFFSLFSIKKLLWENFTMEKKKKNVKKKSANFSVLKKDFSYIRIYFISKSIF